MSPEQEVTRQVVHTDYAIQQFVPDVIVGQQATFGPLISAERHYLPIAMLGMAAYTWATKSFLLDSASEYTQFVQKRYAIWLEIYNNARSFFALPQKDSIDGESPLIGDLFLLRSVPQLEGRIDDLPKHLHFIGDCLYDLPQIDEELTSWLTEALASQKPILYVQPGKNFESLHFWPILVQALANQPVFVIGSVGRMDGEIGTIPTNFFIRNHVSQELVLPHAHAVISSSSTTPILGALTYGLPLLLDPSEGMEHWDMMERCINAKVAFYLSEHDLTIEQVRYKVQQLLDSIELRQNAKLLQDAFVKVGGRNRAANLLEVLANKRRPIFREEVNCSGKLQSNNGY